MAQLTKEICANCGSENSVYFADSEFTDYWCKSCGATNLRVVLPKIVTKLPCKNNESHDIRIAKGDMMFCPKCYTEFGKVPLQKTVEADG